MSYEQIASINQSNANTFLDAVTTVSSASQGTFGFLLLLAVFIGYYFLFSKEQTINDLLASSFVTSIVATLLLAIQVVTWPIYIGCITLMIVIFVLKFWLN